jgi:hypothetical protein
MPAAEDHQESSYDDGLYFTSSSMQEILLAIRLPHHCSVTQCLSGVDVQIFMGRSCVKQFPQPRLQALGELAKPYLGKESSGWLFTAA